MFDAIRARFGLLRVYSSAARLVDCAVKSFLYSFWWGNLCTKLRIFPESLKIWVKSKITLGTLEQNRPPAPVGKIFTTCHCNLRYIIDTYALQWETSKLIQSYRVFTVIAAGRQVINSFRKNCRENNFFLTVEKLDIVLRFPFKIATPYLF